MVRPYSHERYTPEQKNLKMVLLLSVCLVFLLPLVILIHL